MRLGKSAARERRGKTGHGSHFPSHYYVLYFPLKDNFYKGQARTRNKSRSTLDCHYFKIPGTLRLAPRHLIQGGNGATGHML